MTRTETPHLAPAMCKITRPIVLFFGVKHARRAKCANDAVFTFSHRRRGAHRAQRRDARRTRRGLGGCRRVAARGV